MHIGQRIAQTRKKRRMSQGNLAKGVVSVSHLSNIETGRYQPSEDILLLFSKKLSVPKEYFIQYHTKLAALELKINELRKNIIVNMNLAEEMLHEIKEEYPYINSLEQELIFNLCYCCYLAKKGKIKEAQEKFEEWVCGTNKEEYKPPEHMKELYYHYYAVLYFYKEEYEESAKYFKKQLHSSSSASIPHVNYNLGLSLYKLGYFREAINYCKDSLKEHLYKSKWLQATKAYNLLGICLLEEKLYEEAIQQLGKGLEISITHNFTLLTCKLLHNLGVVFTRQGDNAKGLIYLSQALHYKKKYHQDEIFITYNLLIKCLVNLDRSVQLHECINEAKKYMKSKTDQQLYNVALARVELQKGNFELYEDYMTEAIAYFQSRKQWGVIITLSEEMGDYYYGLKRYKKAADYYKMELNRIQRLK